MPEDGRGYRGDYGPPRALLRAARGRTAIAAWFRSLIAAASMCNVPRTVDSTLPLTDKEIRALRQQRRENLHSRFVFNTERGGPVTRAWFLKMVRRTGGIGQTSLPNSSAHAAPWLRLQARQRRRRHPRAAALPRPPQHHAHGAIYRATLRPLRWVLEGLTYRGVRFGRPTPGTAHCPPFRRHRARLGRGVRRANGSVS